MVCIGGDTLTRLVTFRIKEGVKKNKRIYRSKEVLLRWSLFQCF